MYNKITVQNNKTRLRNGIIITVLALGLLFGGVALVKIWIGDALHAENSSGLVPGTGGQELFAYLKPGETIEATLTTIPFSEGGPLYVSPEYAATATAPNYCVALGQAPNSIYCNDGYPIPPANPDLAKVTITGPNGASHSANFPADFNRDDLLNNTARQVVTTASLPSESVAPAVWRIKIDQHPSLFMRFRWEVNVVSGGTRKPGRVWADELRVSQINSKEHPIDATGGTDLVYYAQRSDGYRYKITQMAYNGFGSTLKIGAFGIGLPDESGCASAYGSVEIPKDPNGNNWVEPWAPIYIPDPAGKKGKSLDNLPRCSGLASYRIFFEEPFSTDPEISIPTAPDWNGDPVSNIYNANPVAPQITAHFESTNNYIGNAVIENHDSYYGNATLELDADGNNTDDYVAVATFGIADAITKIPLDGTKNNHGGEKIPLNTLVKGRVVLSYLGEIHIISLDIEERGWMDGSALKGGIEVERENGGADNKFALFWDDGAPWLSPDRATKTPQMKSALPTGTNSQGGVHAWTMPETYAACTDSYATWAITSAMKTAFAANGVICPFEKIGHWNERQLQSWGDNRAIEDWTYDIGRTALLQQTVRDDSYFEYIYRDNTPTPCKYDATILASDTRCNICSISDAVFAAYLANLTSTTEIAAETAARVACAATPCPYDSSMLASDAENCKPPVVDNDPCALSSVEAIMSKYTLDRDAAQKVYNNCHPAKNPNTGLQQKEEQQGWQVVK